MRNLQAEQVIKLPRLTFAILLLLILTGAVGIAQQNNEDTISSIRGTYHPAPAHRAATVHKAHRPIVHVVIRRMASPRNVTHFALRHLASARTTHHRKARHATITAQAHSPRYRTMMPTPSLDNKQSNTAEAPPAPTAPQVLHWATNGNDQFLEVSGGEVHLKPRTEGTGPGNVTATCKFTVPDTRIWQLSFDIRYGVLRDQAGGLHLYRGRSVIGYIGADGFYKDMGVFLGNDNQIWRMTADTEWHHISFMSDGSKITVGCDGRQIGTGAAQTIPDSLDISNSQDMNVPCHQEGLWVRNIVFPQIGMALSTKINPKDGAEMVYVPPGPFLMGDDDITDNPRHTVMLSGYYIYKNDVTVAMYRKFCRWTGRAVPSIPTWGWKEDNPMVDVAWDDAKAYCDWAGVHLPTEAQWEKAARGTDGRFFPWGNDWDTSRLRCSKNNVGDAGSTAPAGSTPSGASPCGALDMAGNVWNWCADWYDENYWKNANGTDPTGPRFASLRVVRGGSWGDFDNKDFRSAFRLSLPLDFHNYNNGFRGAFGP